MLSAPGKLPEEDVTTCTTGYLRMHGKNNWYNYLYSKRELSVWKMKLEKLEVEKIYIFFNNDVHAHAVRNALTLKEIF